MVSITLSVPEQVKETMSKFDEVNWSGFIRKCILKKTEELTWKDQMLKSLEVEKPISEWSVKAQRAARAGRFEALRKKGLI